LAETGIVQLLAEVAKDKGAEAVAISNAQAGELMEFITLSAGYREIEHTADWQLDVWAPDLGALLEQAARGMYALAGVRLTDGPRQAYDLEVPFHDPEGLLVAFLSELLFRRAGLFIHSICKSRAAGARCLVRRSPLRWIKKSKRLPITSWRYSGRRTGWRSLCLM
jgi:hypothetical protein